METPSKALKRIEECKENKSNRLDLSGLRLKVIPQEIAELTQLEGLYLHSNQLTKIEGLEKLVNLSELYLSYNRLTKIEGLEKLVNLSTLFIYNNQLTKIEGLEKLVNLSILFLSDNQLTKIEGLEKLVNLSTLYLSNNQLTKIEGLENFASLSTLDLSENRLTKIEGLEKLTNLSILHLTFTQLTKIEGLDKLANLSTLYLWGNQLTKIEGLDKLVNLSTLYLNINQLTKIKGLENLANLSRLNLSSNQLTKIEGLDALFQSLREINLSNNPISELPADSLGNLEAIKGYLQSRKSTQLIPNKYLKINILGDGRIGKTQLHHFFEGRAYQQTEDDTYGTNTTLYTIPNEDYQALIWDFGGQYYHHGFHQVFIRPRDFNLVLWSNKHPEHPNYGYWLGTARNYSPNSPLFLIQNLWESTDYADEKDTFVAHNTVYPENKKLQTYSVGLDSVFGINVKALHEKDTIWQIRHDYFLNTLHQVMKNYAQTIETFSEVPEAWVDVKKDVAEHPFDGLCLNREAFRLQYAQDFVGPAYEILLVYLEFTGSILYFQNHAHLKHYIFPNPTKLSDWIYQDILNREFKKNNEGVLNFANLIVKIGYEKAQILRTLMTSFNLLFVEKGNENHLVIPQFLPEQNNTFKHYLLDLIPYSFCIRFEDFFHEGRIFQFISEYGEFALDTTSYWRYGIIFTKNEVKTLVYYDGNTRTIFVHIEEQKGRINIAQEIFDYFVKKDKPIKLIEFANQMGVDVNAIIKAIKNTTQIELYANSMISKEYREFITSTIIIHMRTGNFVVP